MADPSSVYTREAYKQTKHLATWFPGSRVALGDIGHLHRSLWSRSDTLPSSLTVRARTGATMPNLDWQVSSGVNVHTKVAGQFDPLLPGVPPAEAGIGYSFSRRGGTVFQARECIVEEIEDLAAVKQWMLTEARAARLTDHTLVVTRLIRTRACAILAADQANSSVEISVSGGGPIAAGQLADVAAEARVTRSRGMTTQLLTANGATPLFGGLVVRSPTFSALRIADLMLGDRASGTDDEPLDDLEPAPEDDDFWRIGLPQLT